MGLSDPPPASETGVLQHSLPAGLRTNPADQAPLLLCRSQGPRKKILLTLPCLPPRTAFLATARPLPHSAHKRDSHPLPRSSARGRAPGCDGGGTTDPSPIPPPANPSAEPGTALPWKRASLEAQPRFLGDSELPQSPARAAAPRCVPGCSTRFWCGKMGAAGTLWGRLSSPFPRCPPSCSRSCALGVGQGLGSAGSQGLAECRQHGAPAALTPHPGAKRQGAGFQRDACDPGEGSDTKVRRKALPSATLPAGAALPPSPAEHETAAGGAGRPCLPLKCLPPVFS